jgi:acetyl esterase
MQMRRLDLTLPAALQDGLDAANLAGVKQIRALTHAMRMGRDTGAPSMETVNFALPGPAGDIDARLYRPEGIDSGGPALIFFHGGGFVLGDLDTNDAFVRRLADAAGLAMISVQYRLAPEARWPAPLEDALAANRWIIAQAAEMEIDGGRIGLAGDSAGGYLSIAASGGLNAERAGTIAAQLLIYPLLHIDDEVWKTAVLTDSRIVGRAAVAYIRTYCAHPEAAIPALAAADFPTAPPTLVITGGALDPIRPDARRYADDLEAAGVIVQRLEYPALPHGFGSFSHLLPASRRALAEIGALAGRMMRG